MLVWKAMFSDGLNDLADVLLALQNLAHGPAHLLHPLVADADLVGGLIRLLLGGLGGLPVGLGGVVQIIDGGGEFLYRAGLLRGALRQSLSTGGNLVGTGGHLVGGLEDAAHGVVEVDQQEFNVFLDGSQFAGILLRHGDGQITVGQALGNGDDILNGISLTRRWRRFWNRSPSGTRSGRRWCITRAGAECSLT